jgi:hypothetical protein
MSRLQRFAGQVSGSLSRITNPRLPIGIPATNNWVDDMFSVRELDDGATQGAFSTLVDDIFSNKIDYNADTGLMRVRSSGDIFMAGMFYAPTLREILDQLASVQAPMGQSRVVIIQNQDASKYIVNTLGYCQMVQAASQCNGLEMIEIDVTPDRGIGVYINDATQGPAVALSAAPGTFIRNYWLTKQLMAQFNSLHMYKISHTNGYLIWGDRPGEVLAKLSNPQNEFHVRVPYMLYTQVVGFNDGRSMGGYKFHHTNKLVHQAYTSSAPIATYRNSGPLEQQRSAVFYLLVAEFRSLIAMSILLWSIDRSLGLNSYQVPTVDMSMIGAGVFKNPKDLVTAAMRAAMCYYKQYQVEYRFHAFPDTISFISGAFGQSASGVINFDTLQAGALEVCRSYMIGGYLVDRLQQGIAYQPVQTPQSQDQQMINQGRLQRQEAQRQQEEYIRRQGSGAPVAPVAPAAYNARYDWENYDDFAGYLHQPRQGPLAPEADFVWDAPNTLREEAYRQYRMQAEQGPVASRPASPPKQIRPASPPKTTRRPPPRRSQAEQRQAMSQIPSNSPFRKNELVLASGELRGGSVLYKYFAPEDWQVTMINKIVTAPAGVDFIDYYVPGGPGYDSVQAKLYREMVGDNITYYYIAPARPGVKNYMIPLSQFNRLQQSGYNYTTSANARGTTYNVMYGGRPFTGLVPMS